MESALVLCLTVCQIIRFVWLALVSQYVREDIAEGAATESIKSLN
jgi:hypothetical protein